MGNHGFIKFKTPITFKNVMDKIEELNQTKFGGLLIAKVGSTGADGNSYVTVTYNDNDQGYAHFGMGLNKGGKVLEWNHHGDDLHWYLQDYFSCHIAAQYGGMCADEGVGDNERWKPTMHLEYPTFYSYCFRFMDDFGKRDRDAKIKMSIGGKIREFTMNQIGKSSYRGYVRRLSPEMRKLEIFKKGKI